jgi:hypothetical protein
MNQILVFLIGAAIPLVAYSGYVSWQKRLERQAALRAAAEWIAGLADKGIRLKVICGEAPGVILGSDEELLGVFPQVALREPRAVRVSRGHYSGQSIRVAKGVSLRVGGYRGSSESHDELRSIDQGTLVVTSQRLVFTGAMRTSSVPLEKIVDVEGYDDGLELHRQGKEKVEYFQFSGGIEMSYQCDGKSLLAPVCGQVVKHIVAQAIQYRLRPEGLVGLQNG